MSDPRASHYLPNSSMGHKQVREVTSQPPRGTTNTRETFLGESHHSPNKQHHAEIDPKKADRAQNGAVCRFESFDISSEISVRISNAARPYHSKRIIQGAQQANKRTERRTKENLGESNRSEGFTYDPPISSTQTPTRQDAARNKHRTNRCTKSRL